MATTPGVANAHSFDNLPAHTETPPISPEPIIASTPDHAGMTNGKQSLNVMIQNQFFIIKGLTVQDLMVSVRDGTWATQVHNERTTDDAFRKTDTVYLIFSANGRGAFFGYARIVSGIFGELPANGAAQGLRSPTFNHLYQVTPTFATDTASRGRIVEDRARGTIFWGSEISDGEENDMLLEHRLENRCQNPLVRSRLDCCRP